MIHGPPPADLKPLSDQDRAASLHATMAGRPAGQPVRVFAYGSLIWDPCFDADEEQRAALQGWRRHTCLWSIHARGTPEAPGLFYGLDQAAGARCDGVLFTLSEAALAAGLSALWEREMYAGVYKPVWLSVSVETGSLTALTFVVDRTHPNYTGDISLKEAAAFIANARGTLGSCADYYRSTLQVLATRGIDDADLTAVDSLINGDG